MSRTLIQKVMDDVNRTFVGINGLTLAVGPLEPQGPAEPDLRPPQHPRPSPALKSPRRA